MALARVTTKGQVTIPAEVRKVLDIGEGDELLFEVVRLGKPAFGCSSANAYRTSMEHFRPYALILARRRFGLRSARVLESGWRDGSRASAPVDAT